MNMGNQHQTDWCVINLQIVVAAVAVAAGK